MSKPITLPELRESVERARLQAELASLEESWGAGPGIPTDFGTIALDRYWDRDGLWWPVGAINNRRAGQNAPVVRNEIELSYARDLARVLIDTNATAQGILSLLTSFVIGPGFTYKFDSDDPELKRRCEDVWDEFCATNEWTGTTDLSLTEDDPEDNQSVSDTLEREIFKRSRVDGEVYLRYFPRDDGRLWLRFIEPEYVRQPPGSTFDEYSFGHRNPMDPVDIQRCLEISVQSPYDLEWEGIEPPEFTHAKCNVVRTVKRGLSDFFSTREMLELVRKMVRNMLTAGGVQSALAWIEQYPAASQAAVQSQISQIRDLNRPQYPDPVTGKPVNYERFEPGTVLKVSKGREYVPAPLAQNTTQHVQIIQSGLRCLTTRWGMPEYMTGDASNANYASTLVSGAPFVRLVKDAQEFYKKLFLRVLWKVFSVAAEYGLLPPLAVLRKRLRIQVEGPPPEIVDQLQQAQVDGMDITNGVMSLQTRRAHRSLDDDQERRNLQLEPPTRVAGKATDVDAQGNPVRQPGGGGGGGEGPGGAVPQAGERTEGVPSGAQYPFRGMTPEAVEALERFIEACVPNKSGPGHHEDHTGHPCSPGGNRPGAQNRPSGAPVGDRPAVPAKAKEPGKGIGARVKAALGKAGETRVGGWIKGAAGKAKEWGLKLGAGASAAEHWVHTVVAGALDGLPFPEPIARAARTTVRRCWNLAMASWSVGSDAVAELARDKGASDEHAQRVSGVCATLDVILAKPAIIAAEVAHLGTAALGVAGFLPIGSAMKLAVSACTDPVAVGRAVLNAVGTTWDRLKDPEAYKITARTHEAVDPGQQGFAGYDPEAAALLLDRYAEFGDDLNAREWYETIVYTCLDYTENLDGALRLADKVAAENPAPPGLVEESEPAGGIESIESLATRIVYLERLLEAGFTGEKKDKRGRRNCYSDGKRVACPKLAKEPKAEKVKPEHVEAHLAGLLEDPSAITPEHIADAAHLLSHLSVAELGDLKKRLGVRASGPKAELARKIAERHLGPKKEKAKPKGKAKRAEKAEAEPVAAPVATPEPKAKREPKKDKYAVPTTDFGAPDPGREGRAIASAGERTNRDTLDVFDALDKDAGGHNFVSLGDLRKSMAEEQGITDKADQDRIILRMRGKELTLSPIEGRHGATPEDLAAAITDADGTRYGFVSRRTAGAKPKPAAAPATAAAAEAPSGGKPAPAPAADVQAAFERVEAMSPEELDAFGKRLGGMGRDELAQTATAIGFNVKGKGRKAIADLLHGAMLDKRRARQRIDLMHREMTGLSDEPGAVPSFRAAAAAPAAERPAAAKPAAAAATAAAVKAPLTAAAVPEMVKRIGHIAAFEHSSIPTHEFADMLKKRVPGMADMTPEQFGHLMTHLWSARTPDGKAPFALHDINEPRSLTPEQRQWTPQGPTTPGKSRPMGFIVVRDDVSPADRQKAVEDALHAYLEQPAAKPAAAGVRATPAGAKPMGSHADELFPASQGVTPRTRAKMTPNQALPDHARPPVTREEATAVSGYSRDVEGGGMPSYRVINRALKGQGQWTPQAKALHEQLAAVMDRIPAFAEPVTVYSGQRVPPDRLPELLSRIEAAHQSGQPLAWAPYMSTTTKETGAGLGTEFDGPVMFKIAARRGLDMRQLSDSPGEDEMLLPHGSQFRVKSVKRNARGVHVIEMEHLDDHPGVREAKGSEPEGIRIDDLFDDTLKGVADPDRDEDEDDEDDEEES